MPLKYHTRQGFRVFGLAIIGARRLHSVAAEWPEFGPPSTRCGRSRATARECGAKRSRTDRADAARPASTMHRRARSHGLAEGLRVQLARSGGGRHLALEARH